MKVRTLLLSAFVAAAVLSHALAPAARVSARQTDARGLGLVSIRTEDGRDVRLYDRSYALVVGVSDYTAGWPSLPGVKSDAEAVSAALERHGFRVTVVMNPDHTQLDKSFKEFISAHGRGVENRLLFYFAGHGHTVKQSYGEEMGYIVPADAPNPNRDPNGFLDKAMSMRQIELYAESIQSKHALFLFDSCFSGSLFALSRAVPESISYKTTRHVRQFITSGSAEERVPDHSIFRRQFTEALAGEGDVNRDGYVTGTELGEFLQNKVVNYSRNAQHPQYGKIRNPNLDKGDFVFALPKAAAAAAATPPASAAPVNQPPSSSPSRVDPAALELAFWDAIKNSTDPEDFKEYLAKYPDGQFAGIARRRVQTAAAPKESTPPSNSLPSGSAAEPLQRRVRVPARGETNGWTDASLMVRRGQRLRITAAGRVSLGRGIYSTPTGLARVVDPEKLMRNEPTGALIAVVGDDNDEFIYIGAEREFYATRDGRLFLGVNEGNLEDNTGVYDALVEIWVDGTKK